MIKIEDVLPKEQQENTEAGFPTYDAFRSRNASPQYIENERQNSMYEPPVRPFVAPKSGEYRDQYAMRDYIVNEPKPSEPRAEEGYGAPQYNNFYEFNAYSKDTKSPEQLMRMLDSSASEQNMRQDSLDSSAYKPAIPSYSEQPQKAKKRVDLKGKIIAVLYAAFAVAIVTLIAVNASKINSGKAVVPSSSVQIVTEQLAK